MLKILWHSNAPWANTGYGCQTRLFTKRILNAGHQVAISAFYGLDGSILNYNGIPVAPKLIHPYGIDAIGAHAQRFGAEAIISLVDAWVLDPGAMAGKPWAAWFPVDQEPVPAGVLRSVAQANLRMVFTRHAENLINRSGLSALYVPHGIETDVFKPIDRAKARQAANLPADRFIVGMVAANKGLERRKAFPQHLMAFAAFKQRHPDSLLYLHTFAAADMQGDNLFALCEFCGLKPGVDVIFADQYLLMTGQYSDEMMNTIYNAMDVHMLASTGEGFGIPTLEAQSAGCPVIVGDWIASSELCFGGWKIDKETGAEPQISFQHALQYQVRIGALVDALTEAYRNSGDQQVRDDARTGALAFDADTVFEKWWIPALAELEAVVNANH